MQRWEQMMNLRRMQRWEQMMNLPGYVICEECGEIGKVTVDALSGGCDGVKRSLSVTERLLVEQLRSLAQIRLKLDDVNRLLRKLTG